jgi:tRNA-specific 2-thiouridylase
VWSSGRAPAASFECLVQIRAHGSVVPARIEVEGDRVLARLHATHRSATPGQALVMYADDVVLGSATIRAAHVRAQPARA